MRTQGKDQSRQEEHQRDALAGRHGAANILHAQHEHEQAGIIGSEEGLLVLQECALRCFKAMKQRDHQIGPAPTGHRPAKIGESSLTLGLTDQVKEREQLSGA